MSTDPDDDEPGSAPEDGDEDIVDYPPKIPRSDDGDATPSRGIPLPPRSPADRPPPPGESPGVPDPPPSGRPGG